MIKNFAIVVNSSKENNTECSEKVKKILENRGCRCTACLFAGENVGLNNEFLYTDPALVPADTDAVISLGGDGTFIHASKDLLKLNLPVFGINFGTLGYLTEVDINGFDEALGSIVDGDYQIENRILLRFEILSDGKVIRSGLALNDIVIQRAIDTGIAKFDINADGRFLNSYFADGIILSTPTGSTGYNLSAGGPVVFPAAEIVLMTPICAHTLNSRSLVFPADEKIEIISKEVNREKNREVFVTVDGEKSIHLSDGDSIRAYKAKTSARIIKIDKMSFIENLGKKMRY